MAGKDVITVVVCGGGNAGHVMAGLAASRNNTDVRVLALEEDEAEEWSKVAKSDFKLSAYDSEMNMKDTLVKLKMVTKEPSKAVPKAEFILLTVASSLHEKYLEAIGPHVSANMTIVGIPGQLGFEFQCFDILKTKAKRCNIINISGQPWAGRIVEFGKSVKILSKEETMTMSIIKGSSKTDKDPVQILQYLLGELPELRLYNNFLEMTLATKYILNAPIMYTTWKKWDGKPFSKKPLFYKDITEEGAKVISDVSEEILAAASEIGKAKSSVVLSNVVHIFETLKEEYKYNIDDDTSLLQAIKTNTALNGYRHPIEESEEGKYVPDFNHRFLSEEVPYGLVILKGICQVAKVKTPVLDRVIKWAQEKLGTEYIVGSKLEGKDIATTRAPQRYGFNSLEDVLQMI